MRTEKGWKIEARDIPKVRAALGDTLLIGFVQAFDAADRLASLTDLREMNLASAKTYRTPKSPQYNRNRWYLLALIFGTLYEVKKALDLINGKGVGGKLGAHESWLRLDAMRKRLNREPIVKDFRLNLAAHLGDEETIKKGLDSYEDKGSYKDRGEATLYEAEDPGSLANSSFPLARDIVFAGLAIEEEDFTACLDRVALDMGRFPQDLQVVFADCIQAHGIDFKMARAIKNSDPSRKR